MSETIRRVSDHPMKTSFEATPRDVALRSEDGWVDMDVRWLFTRETVGAEHSVFGITVFPPGSKHDIHRHPHAEEFEYLVSGHGIARVGDADVELGPGEVVFVPTNDYHGFENTGDEPVFMIWGYAGAANLDEAGLHPAGRRPGELNRAANRQASRGSCRSPAARRAAAGRPPPARRAGSVGPAVTAATSLPASSSSAAGMSASQT